MLRVGSGECDVALAVGVEQMGKMGLLGGGGGGSGIRTEGVIGSGLMPAVFGQAGMEHMRKYGTTQEQFAKIAVKNHKHSTRNPLSQYQVETPLEQVLGARIVAYPNTLYMCCPTGDGAAAAVSCPAEKARELGATVKVLASVLTSDPWTRARPDVARREHADAQRGEAGVREGGRRPRRPRPRRAARLLRDRRAAALREPRPVQGRRSRPR